MLVCLLMFRFCCMICRWFGWWILLMLNCCGVVCFSVGLVFCWLNVRLVVVVVVVVFGFCCWLCIFICW